jgi:hypothetical protein
MYVVPNVNWNFRVDPVVQILILWPFASESLSKMYISRMHCLQLYFVLPSYRLILMRL